MSALPFDMHVSISEPGWCEIVGDAPEPFVARAVEAALDVLDSSPTGELSIALVSDREMAELNAQYRGKEGPTNVLAFPADASVRAHLQGDIVIALQTLLRECHKQRKTAQAHATHLVIHGFLHLQGYDHQTKAEREEMETLERTALARLGIDDPFVMPT